VADARSMIEAAEQAGVKLMIGQVLRYNPPFVWIRDFIASGEPGEPFGMQTTRLGGGWGGRYRATWRMKMETSGGPLFEVAAHEIDFMRQILGEAETVYASMDNYMSPDVDYEDFAYVVINFEGGGRGCLLSGHSGFLSTYDGKVYCTAGTLFFDGKAGRVTYQCKADAEPTVLTYAEAGEGYERGVQREVREFVEAVLTDTEPTIPGIEGLRNTEIAQAAHISAAEGRVVSLPL
jgi:UDP-N-acetylglucosamine 3-dehydrogenase